MKISRSRSSATPLSSTGSFAGPVARAILATSSSLAVSVALRGRALAAYAEHTTHEVLQPLLHMHHNRIVGIDPAGERIAMRLARHAAMAWLSRRELQP